MAFSRLERSVIFCRRILIATALIAAAVTSGAHAAAATKLAIISVTANPTDVAPFAVSVQAQDVNGAPANVAANTTVALVLNAGVGNLSGSLIAIIPAGANSAAFSNVIYDLPESGVTVTAFASSGDALALATSLPFSVSAGPATRLTASVPQGMGTATAPFVLNIQALDDAFNNAVVATDTALTVMLTSGSGLLGGILNGTIPAGTGTLALSLTYTKPEVNVRVRVSRVSGDVLKSTIANVNVADTPTKLFVFAPVSAVVNAPFALQVSAVDFNGVPAAAVVDTTITLTKAQGFGTLSGTLSATLPAGSSTFTFTNLTYSAVDTVKITATASNGDALAPFTTSGFQITSPPAPATKFQVSCFGPFTAGAPFQVRVAAVNAIGTITPVQSDTSFIISLKTGGGTLSGILTGVIPAGSFLTDLYTVAYSQPESGVVLTATAVSGDALAATDALPLNVLGPPAGVLPAVFALPSAGAPFDVNISAIDGSGNPTNVLVDTPVSVNTTPAVGTGTFGGVLSGTILAGSSSVDILTVVYSKQEPAIKITADSPGLNSGVSTQFNVGAAPLKLIVTSLTPGTPVATQPFSIQVTAVDGSNFPARVPANTLVTLTLASGAGSLGTTLSGTIAAGNNFVTIQGITYSQGDSGVSIAASASSLSSGTSNLFKVNAAPIPGMPARIDVRSGNSQVAPAGSPVALPLIAFVRDSNFLPVPGAAVTFQAATGAGSVTGASTITDANGLASPAAWTLGIIGGKNTLIANTNGITVTFTATATGGTGVLVLTSGPNAAPNPAGVAQTVQFSVGANLPDTTFAWSFGDGASDSGGGAVSAHAYAAPGTYSVLVTATSGPQVITGGVAVTVVAPLVGTGNDSDGDGFSDSYEIAAGTNPADPNSAPFAISGPPLPAASPKLAAKLNFSKSNSDTLTVSGIIPVPVNLAIAGAQLGFTLGDRVSIFSLDAHGHAKVGSDSVRVAIKSTRGSVPLQNSKFTLKLAKKNLASALAPFGLINADVTSKAVTINATLVFGRAINLITVHEHYRATLNKMGATAP